MGNCVVYDLIGYPHALVHDWVVYGYSGAYLGVFVAGFFRDRGGAAVAFIEGAQGGPLLPVAEIPPVPPIPLEPAIPLIPPIPPISPVALGHWSGLTWVDYLASA